MIICKYYSTIWNIFVHIDEPVLNLQSQPRAAGCFHAKEVNAHMEFRELTNILTIAEEG